MVKAKADSSGSSGSSGSKSVRRNPRGCAKNKDADRPNVPYSANKNDRECNAGASSAISQVSRCGPSTSASAEESDGKFDGRTFAEDPLSTIDLIAANTECGSSATPPPKSRGQVNVEMFDSGLCETSATNALEKKELPTEDVNAGGVLAQALNDQPKDVVPALSEESVSGQVQQPCCDVASVPLAVAKGSLDMPGTTNVTATRPPSQMAKPVDQKLKPGSRATITSAKKPENIGKEVTILAWNEDKGKYKIETASGITSYLPHNSLRLIKEATEKPRLQGADLGEQRAKKPRLADEPVAVQPVIRMAPPTPPAAPLAHARAQPFTFAEMHMAAKVKPQSAPSEIRRGGVLANFSRQSSNDHVPHPTNILDAGRVFRISKAMTGVLRHNATRLGVMIRSDGYCRVSEVLLTGALQTVGCTEADLLTVVERNDKKRFEVVQENGELWVRASQGHSIKAVSDVSLLHRLSLEDPRLPTVCVHGTYRICLPSILLQGLLVGGGSGRKQRNHIHFAPHAPGDGRTISGIRYNCEVAIYLDLRKAMFAGIPFFLSNNEVVLSPGIEGVVGKEFFAKVVDLVTGQDIPLV